MIKKLFFLSTVCGLFFTTTLDARDLTYKIGAGYKQVYTNGFAKGEEVSGPTQVHGLVGSYGIASDLMIEAFLGFTPNFNQFVMGPSLRYDFHRLLVREARFWEHLNLFAQASFFIKGGSDSDMGIVMQLPYVGFEIFPFSGNNFAIQTAAGVTIDLISKNRFGLTQGMFGDVGVKYYF